MPKQDVVYAYAVTWLDSSVRQGWEPFGNPPNLRVESIGWLVYQTEDVITLTTSVSMHNDHVADAMTIPKRAIIKIKKLRESLKWPVSGD